MTPSCSTLKDTLLRVIDRGLRTDGDSLSSRPVFLIAPNSEIGKRYIPLMVPKLGTIVAAVDDLSTEATIHGVPRWSIYGFVQNACKHPGAIAIDFSVSRFAAAMFERVVAEAGVERIDCVAAFGELDLPAVYESVPAVRQKTLEKLDRFLGLAERFADDFSRATLYAALLLRFSYDRKYLRTCITEGPDEYFSASPTGQTFQLGENEVFCDTGAHIGLVTCKFLGATSWNYKAIRAYEPDRIDYRTLGKMRLLPLHDFHIRNKAVSDRDETLSFVETGTVSSHVSATGGDKCQSIRLDDEMEELTFLKMDIEGFEARALRDAQRLIRKCSPRMAITAYHYPWDMLDIVDAIDAIRPGYVLRLRHHYNFYYDTVLYASPVEGWGPAH